MNNQQENASTFNGYFLTVVIGNTKKGNNDPWENVNPYNYMINNFNSTVQSINWNLATTYETDKLIKTL